MNKCSNTRNNDHARTCRIEKRLSNPYERFTITCIAIILLLFCVTRREKWIPPRAMADGRHDFIIAITSRRSYLIAEVAIQIYLAICRDCL